MEANYESGAKKLLPFKSVNIQGMLAGPTITLDIEMKYQNPDSTRIECDYEFPLLPSTIFSGLECSIDGKKVTAKVKTKEQAKQEYKAAIEAGNAAVLAQRSTSTIQTMKIKLGNLLPG